MDKWKEIFYKYASDKKYFNHKFMIDFRKSLSDKGVRYDNPNETKKLIDVYPRFANLIKASEYTFDIYINKVDKLILLTRLNAPYGYIGYDFKVLANMKSITPQAFLENFCSIMHPTLLDLDRELSCYERIQQIIEVVLNSDIIKLLEHYHKKQYQIIL